METLQRLSRRQVDALRATVRFETKERGAPLTAIAHALGITAPSALGHLDTLETRGLIQRYRGKSRATERGRRTLVEYQRHHRVAESLFGALGFSPEATCSAAREIDLALSHRTVEELCRAQEHPSACPHGQEIAPCRSTGGKA